MRIIGFTAKMQSGKTTAVDHIKTLVPNVVQINFKDALIDELFTKFPEVIREIINIYDKTAYDGMNPWNRERLVKEKPPLFRALMRNYGTDVMRAMSPLYWTEQFMKRLKSVKVDDHTIVLVDDVRFHNEANTIREAGGIIVRIVNPANVSTDPHPSEAEMDGIVADVTFENHFVEGGREKFLRDIEEWVTGK